ncbi:shikimate kinase [Anaerolineales bacterium]
MNKISPEANIILTGFMGAGKSTVGKGLARRLDRTFVDTDQEIELSENMKIPAIFAERGEAYFRSLEQKLIKTYVKPQRLIVSTGGGALIHEASRLLMLKHNFVVCLWVEPDVIQFRLEKASHRPLAANWEALFRSREAIYRSFPNLIDASQKGPARIVKEIEGLWLNALK